MQNIINISKEIIGRDEVNSVNARELHRNLNLKSDFSTWIKKELSLFSENEDYIRLHKKMEANNATRIEYILTLDTAKHLAMLQRTKIGKDIRDYFIKIEKQSLRPLSISEQISIIAKGHSVVEERVKKLEETKRLENWQERALMDAKNTKVYEIAKDDKLLATKLHRKVWALFKKEFHLARYNELPALKFDDGRNFIKSLTFADMV